MTQNTKRQWLRDNPSATFAEYAEATGGNRQSYHNNRYTIKNEVNKPVKVRKYKRRKSEKVVAAYRRRPRGSVSELEASNESVVAKLHAENQELKHQIIGFRAVISYLENQVGLRDSQ